MPTENVIQTVEELRDLNDPIVDDFDPDSTFAQLTEKMLPWCRYCGARISPAWYNCDWGINSLCNAHGVRAVLANGPHNLDLMPYYESSPCPTEPVCPEFNSEERFLERRLANRLKRGGRSAPVPKSRGSLSGGVTRKRRRPPSTSRSRPPSSKPKRQKPKPRVIKPRPKPKPKPRLSRQSQEVVVGPPVRTFIDTLSPVRNNARRSENWSTSLVSARSNEPEETSSVYGFSQAKNLSGKCRGTQIIGRARWYEPLNETIFESNTKKRNISGYNDASKWLDKHWDTKGVVEDTLQNRSATNFAVLKDANSKKFVTCGLLDKVDWAPSGFDYLGTHSALRILIFVTSKEHRRKGYGRYCVACIKDLAMSAMPPKQHHMPIFVCSTPAARTSFWTTPSVGFEDVTGNSKVHNGYKDTCLLQFIVTKHESPTYYRDICCAEFSNKKITIMDTSA